MRGSNGQVALEFLSTYGFAFLILLIALGVISYIGLFNIADLRSDECSFPSGVVCTDFILSSADPASELPSALNVLGAGEEPYLRLILTNGYGVNITAVNMTLTMDQFQSTQDCGMFPGGSTDWSIGENKTFWCPLPAASYVQSQRYDGAVALNFSQQGGSYVHTIKGTLSTRAQ